MGQSIVRWLAYPDTWDFTDNIEPDAQNPHVSGNGYATSVWDVSPDTWAHHYEIYSTPPSISAAGFSRTNIWDTDASNVVLTCEVTSDGGIGINYALIVNGVDITSGDTQSTPADLSLQISTENLTLTDNTVLLTVTDANGLTNTFSYSIIKEDRDTFTFQRRFQHDLSPTTTGDVILDHGEGFTFEGEGAGEVSLQVPTEGKAKIQSIEVEASEDKEEEIEIAEDMIFKYAVGEGRVHEYQLDLNRFKDILSISSNLKQGGD
ncbi:hypothetical protein SAMN05446037_100661 [Anaerovirgula multivorans]|uniref:Uncharacterized protein n=1 Tax=Anaerovirgula multivorans TaxID=312168 RepID=A0A239CQ69_9FIRM|nr:hypothetical protein [Anaerovirgula multivorans]SNS21543.1 hypothetical protein SAMN05446037_100661 [Anaerovirgula multivorans]